MSQTTPKSNQSCSSILLINSVGRNLDSSSPLHRLGCATRGRRLELSHMVASTVTCTVSDAVGCDLRWDHSWDAHMWPLWVASV